MQPPPLPHTCISGRPTGHCTLAPAMAAAQDVALSIYDNDATHYGPRRAKEVGLHAMALNLVQLLYFFLVSTEWGGRASRLLWPTPQTSGTL